MTVKSASTLPVSAMLGLANKLCHRIKQEPKRQRTSSRSPSNSPVVESEEDSLKTAAAKQKPRGAAARSQREKEQRDKERERERVEAANRRKGRAERRKADGKASAEVIIVLKANVIAELEEVEPAPIEETPIPPPASESMPPDIPNPELKPTPAPRKSGRPPQKSRGRLGRNQYSRDAPTPATNGASPAANNDTPNSPQPSATNGTGNGHESSDGTAGHKPTKAKNWRLEKLSWNEIRRPAGAMQNYIAQRQVEMAGEKSSSAPPIQSPAAVTANGEKPQEDTGAEGDDIEVFRKLSTLQMMDDLSRELVHWQRMIAGQNEK